MASILDFLDTEKGKDFVGKAAGQLGESPDKIKTALATGLPMILGGMKKNAKTPEGAAELNKALEDQKHDGSILSSLGGGGVLSSLMSEGSGILQHVFGGKQQKVEEAVGATSGMDSSKISQLLKMAAPVIIGILGNQKRKDNVSQGGIGDLLGSVMGSNSSHDQSMLESFLDKDGDGNIANDMGKMFKGKGGIKGLGDLF